MIVRIKGCRDLADNRLAIASLNFATAKGDQVGEKEPAGEICERGSRT